MAADLFGRESVVRWCEDLLAGRATDARDHPDISWLGGTIGWAPYWTRVWGARALLHLGPPLDAALVLNATRDPAWRVREMALKVIARHALPDPTGRIDVLVDDPVERVRRQAWRALGDPQKERG
jgi:hypothetical protein